MNTDLIIGLSAGVATIIMLVAGIAVIRRNARTEPMLPPLLDQPRYHVYTLAFDRFNIDSGDYTDQGRFLSLIVVDDNDTISFAKLINAALDMHPEVQPDNVRLVHHQTVVRAHIAQVSRTTTPLPVT